jgi:hypothetical protein
MAVSALCGRRLWEIEAVDSFAAEFLVSKAATSFLPADFPFPSRV